MLTLLSASAINKLPQLDLKLLNDSSTNDIYRAIRNHLPSLIPEIKATDISTMSLGLSHSLSRHKLKFSTDKVDTMIIQAISLLDDLDKELNISAMRVKEWYGWHFPEMARIVNDNMAYARIILSMGMRTNAANSDLSEILPEEIEGAIKSAAEISMGTEITTEDLENIQALAEQVVGFSEYRTQLSNYLSTRMKAIAPNLTALVGELIGARLIAHSGSLMNLAKSPASTIQILGAEKALFRALKTKHDTPKYGLIYHSSLIGQATGKNKGKIARVLAAKAALGLRVDALADWSAEGEGKGDLVPEEERSQLGIDHRLKIERRLAALEGKPVRAKGVAIAPNGVSHAPGKWEVKEARKYNPDADGLAGDEPAAAQPAQFEADKGTSGSMKLIEEISAEPTQKRAKKEKKEKKDKADKTEKEKKKEKKDKADKTEKKKKKEKREEVKPIEEIVEDAMEEDVGGLANGASGASPDMDTDETADAVASNVNTNGSADVPSKTNGNFEDDKSETISTVSVDTPDSPPSPTQQERNWQSPIEGNTKDAKKARKKERHARKLILSEERSQQKKYQREKIARKLDRAQRRQKRTDQILRRQDREDAKFRVLAEQAGLPVKRYLRKLERGEIKFGADGKPQAISKKEIKKAKKQEQKAGPGANGDAGEGTKRKREPDEDAESLEKAERKRRKKEAKKAAKAA